MTPDLAASKTLFKHWSLLQSVKNLKTTKNMLRAHNGFFISPDLIGHLLKVTNLANVTSEELCQPIECALAIYCFWTKEECLAYFLTEIRTGISICFLYNTGEGRGTAYLQSMHPS